VDPTYAAAYAGVAETYNQMGYTGGLSPSGAFPKAKAAASRALELDSSNAEAHTALAYAGMYYDWDWPGAERNYRTALTFNPNDAVAHNEYARFLLAMGRFDEAEAQAQQAIKLDPLSAPIAAEAGWVSHYRGRQAEAVTRLQGAIAMDSTNNGIHFMLGRAYEAQRRYQEAMEEYKRNNATTGVGAMGNVDGLLGDREAALHQLEVLDSMGKAGKYVSPYVVALVYNGLGDKDQVFAWLNKAVDERTHWLLWLNRDPRWIPLRSDPRFKAVGRRVGLPT
jgi:tetratricopeptide (TPR) repeat protein